MIRTACSLAIFLSTLGFTSRPLVSPSPDDPTERSDSALVAIRDGFDTRVAALFDAQRGKTLGDWEEHGWNAVQHYAYPRIEYATANLWLEQNIDSANAVLVEYGEYFINHPENVLHRDHFHWHSEMALRLIELFGQHGTKAPGLLKPETENKILEAVWLYCKRRQQDQGPVNTIAEADTKESNTWYIYESENHHAQSFTTQWHFAQLVKDRPGFRDRRYDDGKTAAEQFDAWNEYVSVYMSERAKKGMFVEMMSRDYNHKLMKGFFNVYDFAIDTDLKRRAGMFLDLYFTYWGQEQLNGISGGGKSRLYQDVDPGTSAYGYLFFNVGDRPRFESTLLSAMTTGYRPSLVVVDIVCDVAGRGTYEVVQRPLGRAEVGHYDPPLYHMRTDSGGIVRYAYCTPEFIMGTPMLEARPKQAWALISSQNRSQGVIFAGNSVPAILPQCEKINHGRAYNSWWSVQRKGTLITQKLKYSTGAGPMRVWFSQEALSEPREEKGWVFAESEGAYAAVRMVEGGHHWEPARPEDKGTGNWLYADDEYTPIILEVDQKKNYRSFAEFRTRVTERGLTFDNDCLEYTGLYGDAFTFFADYSQPPRVNAMPVNYAPAPAFASPFLQSDWNSGVVNIQKGTRSLVLDFN